jgi:hypothetical protein
MNISKLARKPGTKAVSGLNGIKHTVTRVPITIESQAPVAVDPFQKKPPAIAGSRTSNINIPLTLNATKSGITNAMPRARSPLMNVAIRPKTKSFRSKLPGKCKRRIKIVPPGGTKMYHLISV